MHGALVSNRATQQFVARVRKTMGNAATDRFLRYYELPSYGTRSATSSAPRGTCGLPQRSTCTVATALSPNWPTSSTARAKNCVSGAASAGSTTLSW